MKLVGISEEALEEIFFLEFPDSMPRQECRDTIELVIADIFDEDNFGLEEELQPEMAITPFYLDRALRRISMNNYRRMSESERRECIHMLWGGRFDR